MERTTEGIRCVVKADPEPKPIAYGGLRIPGAGADAFRLDLAFTDLGDSVQVFVDAFNAENQMVARWQTDENVPPQRERRVYDFVRNQTVAGFKPQKTEFSGPIDAIHIFAGIVKPKGRVVFELYQVKVAK